MNYNKKIFCRIIPIFQNVFQIYENKCLRQNVVGDILGAILTRE